MPFFVVFWRSARFVFPAPQYTPPASCPQPGGSHAACQSGNCRALPSKRQRSVLDWRGQVMSGFHMANVPLWLIYQRQACKEQNPGNRPGCGMRQSPDPVSTSPGWDSVRLWVKTETASSSTFQPPLMGDDRCASRLGNALRGGPGRHRKVSAFGIRTSHDHATRVCRGATMHIGRAPDIWVEDG